MMNETTNLAAKEGNTETCQIDTILFIYYGQGASLKNDKEGLLCNIMSIAPGQFFDCTSEIKYS